MTRPGGGGALRIASLGLLAVALLGLFLPWFSGTISIKGIDYFTDGKVFLGILIGSILVGLIQAISPNRLCGVLLFVGFGSMFAQGVYEITYILTISGATLSDIGIGLFLCTGAGLVGAVTSLVWASRVWAATGQTSTTPTWLPVTGVVVALVAAFGGIAIGHQQSETDYSHYTGSANENILNILGVTGATGNTGVSGHTGSSGSSGNSGNLGDSGNSGNS